MQLDYLDVTIASGIGKIAHALGVARSLPIAIQIRLGNWIVYHISLPGSSQENNKWISRKSNTVNLRHHSTFYEKVHAEEHGVDWFQVNKLSESEYAIHGGGLPLIVKGKGIFGVLSISGLPHIEDHEFGVQAIAKFLSENSNPV